MAARKKRRKPKKTYRFQLTLSGIISIGVVCFCLFMWMFLFGIWAGQTILLPVTEPSIARSSRAAAATAGKGSPVATLLPGAKKKPGVTDQKR